MRTSYSGLLSEVSSSIVLMASTVGPRRSYKVVLLGELGVGKTSLYRRLKNNTFDKSLPAQSKLKMSAESFTKFVKVDGETVMVGNN